jgi:hypothetical protein
MRSNRSVETDTQRLGAARRASDRTHRGAKPLCAAHLRRYAATCDPSWFDRRPHIPCGRGMKGNCYV